MTSSAFFTICFADEANTKRTPRGVFYRVFHTKQMHSFMLFVTDFVLSTWLGLFFRVYQQQQPPQPCRITKSYFSSTEVEAKLQTT